MASDNFLLWAHMETGTDMGLPHEAVTAKELDALVEQTIDEVQADCGRFDERVAIRDESLFDSKTTTEHAIEALRQPDTAWGRHAVALAWLRDRKSAGYAA